MTEVCFYEINHIFGELVKIDLTFNIYGHFNVHWVEHIELRVPTVIP